VEHDVFTLNFAQIPHPRSAGQIANASSRGGTSSAPATFIVGPENRLAAVAVRWMLQSARPSYSPLVVYGPSGSGKSALARGIAQSSANAVYTDAPDFARELASAIKHDKTSQWRARYRAAESLIFEDVTELTDRAAAQLEFIQVLDSLESQNRPVLVTSRNNPQDVPGLAPGLRSRLAGGLGLKLSPPGLAARCAILQRLAKELGLEFSDEALHLIASGLQGTVPELRGAMHELAMSLADRHKLPVRNRTHENSSTLLQLDADEIKSFLAARLCRGRPEISHIVALVANHFGLKKSEMCGPSRRRQAVLARSVAIYLARELTGKGWQSIGRFFANRDHTTILHAYRSIDSQMSDDPALASCVGEMRERITGIR
jgi:chromosomal replication initiator protein